MFRGNLHVCCYIVAIDYIFCIYPIRCLRIITFYLNAIRIPSITTAVSSFDCEYLTNGVYYGKFRENSSGSPTQLINNGLCAWNIFRVRRIYRTKIFQCDANGMAQAYYIAKKKLCSTPWIKMVIFVLWCLKFNKNSSNGRRARLTVGK